MDNNVISLFGKEPHASSDRPRLKRNSHIAKKFPDVWQVVGGKSHGRLVEVDDNLYTIIKPAMRPESSWNYREEGGLFPSASSSLLGGITLFMAVILFVLVTLGAGLCWGSSRLIKAIITAVV